MKRYLLGILICTVAFVAVPFTPLHEYVKLLVNFYLGISYAITMRHWILPERSPE